MASISQTDRLTNIKKALMILMKINTFEFNIHSRKPKNIMTFSRHCLFGKLNHFINIWLTKFFDDTVKPI